jgi:transcriptional regulator with XRE-family HTH domain
VSTHSDISGRLKLLRKRVGKSQKEMASLLDVSIASYQRYERAEFDIPAAVIDRAQDELGVNPDWLWDGKGEMFGKSERQMISAAAFLKTAEGLPGDTMEKDTPSKMRRELVAGDTVEKSCQRVGLELGAGGIFTALRLLVEHAAPEPDVLDFLVGKVKADLDSARSAAVSAAQTTAPTPMDDTVLTACIAVLEEHPRGRKLPPQKKAQAVLALYTLMTHEPSPSKTQLETAIQRVA